MAAQVKSSLDQPSGEPRNQGQQSLNQTPVPTHIRPGPGIVAQAALHHRTCVHTNLFFLLWKVSVKALGDFSPHRPVELAGIMGTWSP